MIEWLVADSLLLFMGVPTYYQYYRCGNQIAKHEGAGTTYHQFDHENLMTQIDFPDGSHNYFSYDADGKRTSKGDTEGYTEFIYQGPDMLRPMQEREESENTVAQYTMGLGPGEHAAGQRWRHVGQHSSCDKYTGRQHGWRDRVVCQKGLLCV